MANKIKSYILFIHIKKNLGVRIGALGVKFFPKGYYLYIGSGKKYLTERLKRHLKMTKSKYWHIDYLLSKRDVNISDIFVSEKTENQLVKKAQNSKGVKPHLDKFGASDSKNITHLFYAKNKSAIEKIKKQVYKW
jgi:sugar fermentation stimulation protein A